MNNPKHNCSGECCECDVCGGMFCRGCYRKSEKVCQRCKTKMTGYRTWAYKMKDWKEFYETHEDRIDKKLGYKWEIQKQKRSCRRLARLLKQCSIDSPPDERFLYGNFFNEYCSIEVDWRVMPIDGEPQKHFGHSFERYFDRTKIKTLYEEYTVTKGEDRFSGWILIEYEQVYYYIDMFIILGSCGSCDGLNHLTYTIYYGKNLKKLVEMYLDDRHYEALRTKVFGNEQQRNTMNIIRQKLNLTNGER